jgi:DNA-binding beta-propeller fold protein YncE
MPATSRLLTATVLLGGALSSLAPAQTGALELYGAGTPGGRGFTPQLWVTASPRPGATNFGLGISTALGGAVAVPLLSPRRASLALFGLQVNVDLSTALFLPGLVLSGSGSGGGFGSVSLPLPGGVNLIGAPLHFQVVTLDPGGAWFGVAATKGLAATPQHPALVVASHRDGVIAIDVTTGVLHNLVDGFSNQDVAFTRDGSHFFLCSPAGTVQQHATYVYDARTFPPQRVMAIMAPPAQRPHDVTVTPDGTRAYVVSHWPQNGVPATIDVYDARPGTRSFGQPFAGGGFNAPYIEAWKMVFAPDSAAGYLLHMGVLTPCTVEHYDTRLGSPTYHQILRNRTYLGKFAFDLAMDPDGTRLFVAIEGHGENTAAVEVLDTATWTPIDWDPNAPGHQDIGREVSVPVTATGRNLESMVIDPRNRFIYFGILDPGAINPSVVRVDIDPPSAGYRTWQRLVLAPSGTLLGVALDPTGQLIYATVGDPSPGPNNFICEIDAATLTVRRSWPFYGFWGGSGHIAVR